MFGSAYIHLSGVEEAGEVFIYTPYMHYLLLKQKCHITLSDSRRETFIASSDL